MRIYFLIGRVEEWLAIRISWVEMRYKDGKTHENGLEKMFLCRKACIVISSL